MFRSAETLASCDLSPDTDECFVGPIAHNLEQLICNFKSLEEKLEFHAQLPKFYIYQKLHKCRVQAFLG